jgi:hypothetical protein
LRRACLDSIFEFHIGDEFWLLVLSSEMSPRFPRAPRALWCGGRIIGSSAPICAKACDDELGLTTMAAVMLAGARTGRIGRQALAGRFWQSVFGRLAGYAEVTGAERLRHDAAIRWTRGFHTSEARIS